MRILVIDDDKAHGESLLELLQALGHDALYAQSYPEARWLLELFRFEVAILDFDMPEVAGPAAAADLRRRFSDMEALIVSAKVLDRTGAEAELLEAEGIPFLSKPVDVDALKHWLTRAQQAREGFAIVIRAGFPVIKYPW